jgi:hypothetical protein
VRATESLNVPAISGRKLVLMASLALLMGALLAPPGGTSSARADANDTAAGALGPILNGQTATGTIGTENDVDWWLFHASSGTEADIALQGLAPESCFGPEATLTDANGTELASTSYPADRNETTHIHRTVGPGTFYLKVAPYYLDVLYCSGFGTEYQYRLWIDSSPSLLSSPPYIPPPPAPTTTMPSHAEGSSGPSTSCRYAQQRVAALSRALRRARHASDRRRIRRNLRTAQSHVRSFC